MLENKVESFIQLNKLINNGDTVVVGFSGGADSTALIHILHTLSKKMNFCVVGAHLHHGIRGEEADSDYDFAETFCEMLNIEFFGRKCNIPEIAKSKKISEETAGRIERYRFFDEIAAKFENSKIATAHNKNDNAETVIHHIIRGSGTSGLCGIPAKRENIIRPLIDATRAEIEDYCNIHGLNYVTDSTNLETEYTRNKIRKNVLPEMGNINSRVISAICRMSELVKCDNDFLEIETNKAFDKYVRITGKTAVLDLTCKIHDALKRRIFIKMAEEKGVELDYEKILAIENMIQKGITGKAIDLIGGRAEISYDKLIIGESLAKTNFDYTYDGTPLYIAQCNIWAVPDEGGIILPEDSEIHIRSRKDGDKIKSGNMTKKVKDVFISKKIPRDMREKIPVVTVDDEIVYIQGILKADILKKYNKNSGGVVLKFTQGEYNNE